MEDVVAAYYALPANQQALVENREKARTAELVLEANKVNAKFKEQDLTVTQTSENNYKVVGTPAAVGDLSGTGFFTELTKNGVKTIKVDGVEFTIGDGTTVTAGAAAAKLKMAQVFADKGSAVLTLDVLRADGTYAPVTYTATFAK